MERDIQSKVEALRKDHRQKRRWYRIISALACVTIFFTTYALCFPAMTIGEDDMAICGMKTHAHNEECYSISEDSNQMVLTCKLKEHKHDSSCFEGEENQAEVTDNSLENTAVADFGTEDQQLQNDENTNEGQSQDQQQSNKILNDQDRERQDEQQGEDQLQDDTQAVNSDSEQNPQPQKPAAEALAPKAKSAAAPLAAASDIFVALNPGNGAGTAGSSDSENALFDYGSSGGPERVQINAAKFIKGDLGTVEITLPSDDQLGKKIKLIEGDTQEYTVKKENKYDYKLVGWYNIATGEYFDVSNGPVKAKVNTRTADRKAINNVFYADWIAASYDYGSKYASSKYSTTKAESTNYFVTTKLYDFNELFNIYSASLTQNKTEKETWNDKGKFGDTDIKSFAFQSYPHYHNGLGYLGNMQKWNQSGVTTSTVDNGYRQWDVGATGRDHAILNKLFDTSSSALGAHYIGEGDYLFHKEKDKYGIEYFEYDSHKNGASYNQSNQRFYVWDDLQYIHDSNGATSVFLPYNDNIYNTGSDNSHDGSVNYWFGMTSEIGFYLPDDVVPGRSNNNKLLGTDNKLHDMIYSFSGDDDVWIFIDDQLVADLGGNHYPLGADLNFGQGTMTYTKVNVWEGTSKRAENFSRDGGKTHNLPALSKGYHTLKVYYLERGGGFSNLRIKFNIVDSPVGAMTVGKEVEAKDSSVNADVLKYVKDTLTYRYRVLQADKNGNAIEGKLYIPGNTEYTILDSRNIQIGTGVTDKNGYFTLKSGQYARFEYDLASPPSPKYIVEETIPEKLDGQYADVRYKIGSGMGDITGISDESSKFVSYRTPAQKGDDEKKVTYHNILDTEKLAWLTVEKRQSAGSDFDPDRVFTMKVKINNQLIPEGTHYLIRKTGKTDYTDYLVKKAGEIKLHVGETAMLREGFPAGTRYDVTEEESEKCLPIYENNSGVISGNNARVPVIVINKEIKTKTLTVIKKVMDEGEGTFGFRAEIYDEENMQKPRIVDFKLKHNESYTIDEIPMGARVTVTETDSDGYVPLIKSKDGEVTLASSESYTYEKFNDNEEILFYNSAEYELPETGGTGTKIFTIVGFTLMACALTGGFFLRRKRERRE